MRIFKQFTLLAAALLLTACTTETLIDRPNTDTDNGIADDSRREVLLMLKNRLSIKAATTKSGTIATAQENYIRSMDIYVFGSDKEDGEYTFHKLYYYRDDATQVAGDFAHPFNLTVTPGENSSAALLKLDKGLFVKVYCIANRTRLYQTDAAGVAREYIRFQPLMQSAPGQPGNKIDPGYPSEKEFLKLHACPIDPAANPLTENDVLQPPLPMSGFYTTPLDLTNFGLSARTQISLKLNRMTARFDIVNNAVLSRFTIKQVSMVNGQRSAGFFPIRALDTEKAKLISYPSRSINADTQQAENPDAIPPTTAVTRGGFYTWPSLKGDDGYLVLKGIYAVNETETLPVSYKVPFIQICDGAGSYIEVDANHRYTIAITDADPYHLGFSFSITEWSDDNEIDWNPIPVTTD